MYNGSCQDLPSSPPIDSPWDLGEPGTLGGGVVRPGRGARDRCEPLIAMQQNTERKRTWQCHFARWADRASRGPTILANCSGAGMRGPVPSRAAEWMRYGWSLPCLALENVPLPELGSTAAISHWGRQHFAVTGAGPAKGPAMMEGRGADGTAKRCRKGPGV